MWKENKEGPWPVKQATREKRETDWREHTKSEGKKEGVLKDNKLVKSKGVFV